MKSIPILLAVLCLPRALTAAQLEVAEVINTVLKENPSIQAAESRWLAARERVPQARAWGDPSLKFKLIRDQGPAFGDLSGSSYELTQEIPLSGKNLVRGRIASAEAEREEASLLRQRNALIALARIAYNDYANARGQLAINARNRDLLHRLVEATRTRYETSEATQGELLNAETALAELDDESATFGAAVQTAAARLNVLMNRDPSAPLGDPAPPEFAEFRPDIQEYGRRALALRPEMRAAFATTKSAEQSVELAKRSWIPDPQLIAEPRTYYAERQGDFNYDTGIQFSIPWVNPSKYKAAEREARHQAEAALRDLQTERLVTLGTIREALATIHSHAHHFVNYRDRVVPLARQASEANQIAFENASGSFREMLEAQLSAQNAESRQLDFLTDYLNAIADLESFAGMADTTPATHANRH